MEVEAHPLKETSYMSSPLISDNFQTLLTPEKVKERLKILKYDGDPDLHPIRTHENQFLVRSLYKLSVKINEDYRPVIYRLYHDSSFLGKIAKQIINPPMTVYKYDKSKAGRSPRIPVYLPPRISLRYFASHKFLAYMIIAFTICHLLGYHSIFVIVSVIFVWFIYICFKAFFHKTEVDTVNHGNISFNN